MEEKKASPTLNDEQKKAAFAKRNAVVAAGAGSGKTMVLASRFAWLVTEEKLRVREILTLTFTKKATAQMYRRIHLLLTEIARGESPESSAEKRALAAKALDEFAQARIQTLDSYCAAIVKQAANRYGISPEFSSDNERCRQLAIDEALPFFISKRDHPLLKWLYSQKIKPVDIPYRCFADPLFLYSRIDSPFDPAKSFGAQCAIICAEYEKLFSAVRVKLNELAEANEENPKYHPDLGALIVPFSEGRIAFPSIAEIHSFFDALITHNDREAIEWAESQPLHGALVGIFNLIAELAGLKMSKGPRKENPVKDLISNLRELFAEFSAILVFCLQAGVTYSMMSLFAGLQKAYLAKKRAESVLTFDDIARLARAILLEQRDIRQSEKEAFRAVMIDEFQDNNDLQKDLLFLLAEKNGVFNESIPPANDLVGGKLFFVGDEKQSIYRFRGADVSVFRKLKDELGSGDLPLSTNYRSAPLLIGAFNAIFGGSPFDPEGRFPPGKNPAVFAPNIPGNPLPLYEASYTPLRAAKTEGGKLTLCILDKEDQGDSSGDDADILPDVESEARFVAGKVNELINGPGPKKYNPGDIAILFRSRTHQRHFEKHLMFHNIPYASEALSGFFYGGPVNDLLSALRLAAYPTDRAAYAQMLRSPFAGLSVPGLALCINALNARESDASPFDDGPVPLLPEPDLSKYKSGQRVFRKILAMAQTGSIASLLDELWFSEGYRYETAWNPGVLAYRELYDYLFHLAVIADEENKTLAAFTDEMVALSKSDGKMDDLEIPLERPNAVHLITIHKSKGLEFPVVFLCCCDGKNKSDTAGNIYETECSGLTMKLAMPPACIINKHTSADYFWDRAKAVDEKKNMAELRRLLYVAMTRAESELYLSGGLPLGEPQDGPDDFSLRLKRYINEKARSAGKSGIEGDSALDGKTFFGLCLPAFGANIPDEGLDGAAPGPFFSVEEIPHCTEQDLRDAEETGTCFSNDQRGLDLFFEKAAPYYGRSEIIDTPDLPNTRFTPTSLNTDIPAVKMPAEFMSIRSGENSGESGADVFGKVDKLLAHYEETPGDDRSYFNAASFGTIAHICVEALLDGHEAVIPAKMEGFLPPRDAEGFLEAGKELALRFSRSPLGRKAAESQNRRCEFPFRTLLDGAGSGIFINGTIDLVFEDGQTVFVVDFKTDSQENPEAHFAQMGCYYRAASALFAAPQGKRCEVWLYYLRSGHAVDVTEPAKFLLTQ